MKRYIPYGHQSISAKDIATVTKVLQSDFLTQGPAIIAFEEKLAKFVGAKYCVVVNSGTAALHTAYFACGLGAGDELVTSPMTFAATSNAALYLGATAKFVDIEPSTGNIDATLVAKAVSKKTKIVAPIHYGGLPVDLKSLAALKKKHGFKIVEDACHALGAEYQNSMIGRCKYSDATVFSFHPVKHITTGEGGAVMTNDKTIYQRALLFRTHGITKNRSELEKPNEGDWYHEMKVLGFNYRMPDIQAALGSSQLGRLPAFLTKRRAIAARYDKAFAHNSWFDLPPALPGRKHAYHLYVMKLKPEFAHYRKKLFTILRQQGLGVQVHYLPVYHHPYYRELGYKIGLCPKAEQFYTGIISLPMYPDLTVVQQKEVVAIITKSCHDLIRS